ncbi:MAG: glycosyltransferase family 4 protein [Anaerolineae bacterium]
MRVVMLGPFGLRRRGTMSRRALPLARALQRRGHHVSIIVPPWDSPADAGHVAVEDGVEIVQVPVPSAPEIVRHLITEAMRRRPDVLHLFKPKGHVGLVLHAALLARGRGWWRGRLLVDADDWEGPGGWNDRAGYPGWARWLFAWQERAAFRLADGLTVASRWLRAQARSLGAAAIWHLPNGADVQGSIRRNVPSGPPTALLLTRFIEFSPLRLVDIWAETRRWLPEARLIIAGHGLRDEDRVALRLFHARGFEDSVLSLGKVAATKLKWLYDTTTLSLFPAESNRITLSKCPARLVDAMAYGHAVVASRIGEHETYVIDGQTGLLPAVNDDEGFGQAVASLLADPKRALEMGQAAQDRIREHFTWDRLALIAENAYRGIEHDNAF